MNLLRNPVGVARFLITAELISISFSPALSNLFELLLLLMFFFSHELRIRLLTQLRHPVVMWTLLFYFLLLVGVAYSMAPLSQSIGMLSGWRKILLLPLALVLFDSKEAKLKLMTAFVVAMSFAVVLSFTFYFLDISYRGFLPGDILRNYAFQSLLFSVAAFTSVWLIYQRLVSSFALRLTLSFSIILWLVNVVFLLQSRTGYMALLFLSISFVAVYLRDKGVGYFKVGLAGIVAFCLAFSLLLLSPVAHQRLTLALTELTNYQLDIKQETSIGIRAHLLINTLQMIPRRPLLGAGTGGFAHAYAEQTAGTPLAAVRMSDPHNQYLNIAGENGLLGLFVFLMILAAAFRTKADRLFRVPALLVLMTWCMSSLFNSHFGTFSEGRFVFLWVGAMLAIAAQGRKEKGAS